MIQLQFENTEKRDQWIDKHFPNRKMTQTPGIYTTEKGELSVNQETVMCPEVELGELPRPKGWEWKNTGGHVMCQTYETEHSVIFLGNSLGYIGASIVNKETGNSQVEIKLEEHHYLHTQIQSAHNFMRFISQTHGAN